MTHDEMIAVIKAHKEGRTLEWRSIAFPQSPGPWVELHNAEFRGFSFLSYDYRIKSEPREWWIHDIKQNDKNAYDAYPVKDTDPKSGWIGYIKVREAK